MNKRLIVCSLAVGLMWSLPAAADHHEQAAAAKTPDAVVKLSGQNQQEVGEVEIFYGPEDMMLNVEVTGMSEGWHGFHIHETGSCDFDNAFKGAGGHAHMDAQEHGVLASKALHSGDLPNIWVGANGAGKAQFITDRITKESLSDADGSAFIMHEGADDYTTPPSGDSGARVACGVIFPGKE